MRDLIHVRANIEKRGAQNEYPQFATNSKLIFRLVEDTALLLDGNTNLSYLS